jgi:hypothetical protein
MVYFKVLLQNLPVCRTEENLYIPRVPYTPFGLRFNPKRQVYEEGQLDRKNRYVTKSKCCRTVRYILQNKTRASYTNSGTGKEVD